MFSDRDIAARREEVEAALCSADAFFGSLLFDYDQVSCICCSYLLLWRCASRWMNQVQALVGRLDSC